MQIAEFVDVNRAAFAADPQRPADAAAGERARRAGAAAAAADRDAQQQPTDAQLAAGRRELLMHSVIEKQYKLKLREFRQLLSPEALRELAEAMPPSLLPQLDAVLQDVAALGGEAGAASWEEEEGGMSPAEQQLLRELEASVHLPDEFSRCDARARSHGLRCALRRGRPAAPPSPRASPPPLAMQLHVADAAGGGDAGAGAGADAEPGGLRGGRS
jgi:hypothetical protein